MTPAVLPFYAALFAIFFVALSLRTVRMRRRLRIAIGDSGDDRMLRAMRVHSNFAEYVPLCLFLVYLVEIRGANPLMVHGLCLALLVGRLSHAYGVSQPAENYRFRIFGMIMTFAVLLTAAVSILLVYLR